MQRLVFDPNGNFPSLAEQTIPATRPSSKRKPKKAKARAIPASTRRPFSDGVVGMFVAQ